MDLFQYSNSKSKLGTPSYEFVKITEKSEATTEVSSDTEKVTTIEFDFLKLVSISDNYRTNVDTFSHPIVLPMIQIADIVHLNSSVVIAGKTTTEKATASSLIKFFSISAEWETMMISITNPYGYKSVFYRYAMLFLDYDIQYIDEYENVLFFPPFSAIKMLYEQYQQFKKDSNIHIEVELNIPTSILERLKLHTPKLLNGQPVMIESIKYALGKKGTQQVTLRTLRPYADR
jgi:hypothetical protein